MIEETTTRYLESVDNGLPGLVEGFYLVGSAALGAWQPGVSDIDTIILTSRPLTAEDRPALEKVHADLADRAIAHRAGALQQFTFADLRAAAASVHAVADDACNRFG